MEINCPPLTHYKSAEQCPDRAARGLLVDGGSFEHDCDSGHGRAASDLRLVLAARDEQERDARARCARDEPVPRM